MYGNNRGFAPRRSFAPVNVGDELDVTIEAVGEKGDGIAKKDGFVLFVPNAQEGSQVKIKVTKVLKKVGFAEIIGEGETQPQEETPAAAPVEDDIPQGDDSEDFGEEQQAEEPVVEQTPSEEPVEEPKIEAEEPSVEVSEEPKEEEPATEEPAEESEEKKKDDLSELEELPEDPLK